ncbi:MAG: hypothetical protein R3B09_28225 [Nannocystaceae bacterium]
MDTPSPRRSRAAFVSTLALALGLVVGCGGAESDSDADSATSNITTSPQTNPGSAGSTSGGSMSGGSTASTGGTGEDGEETCQRYIECVAVTSPADLPQIQEGFGAGGPCWTQGPQEAENCAQACRVGLQQAHEDYPDEPKCDECTRDDQCDQGAGEFCYDDRCQTTHCGDGVVEPGEVCDGQSLCDDDCTATDVCSPLTGAGCDEGSVCAFSFTPLYVSFCVPPEDNYTVVGLDAECGDFLVDGELSVLTCEVGAYCVQAPLTSPPCATERCCRLLCDRTQPDTCPAGLECVPLPLGEVQLEYIGACQ